jgi:hypothetical protein
MTHWILQNNIYSEEGWDALVGALERLGITYSTHKCVPFAGTLEPEANPPEGRVIVMGSYTLANHAYDRGWTPGAWLGNLDFRTQRRHWGIHMLNVDAVIATVELLNEVWGRRFIRPVHDTKSFTGQVFDHATWAEFRTGVMNTFDAINIGPETLVMVCSPKEIYSETRCWIVDGKVVTCSGYKVGTIKRYTAPELVDAHITRFAQEMAEKWSPNRAYVMDVCETPAGLRIVEVNNLNSAGFYKADMNRLVQALESMP